jgi:hypothetical protein
MIKDIHYLFNDVIMFVGHAIIYECFIEILHDES